MTRSIPASLRLLPLLAALAAPGCVKRSLYEQALVDLQESRKEQSRLGMQAAQLQREVVERRPQQAWQCGARPSRAGGDRHAPPRRRRPAGAPAGERA